jgi:hypothetical protein
MGNGAIHDAHDAGFPKDGHAAHDPFQPRHNGIEFGFEQFVFRVPGLAAGLRPRLARITAFVDPDQA